MSSTMVPRRFARLAIATAVAGYLLIVVGGTVRVTGAGMGCGPDWPLCNGQVIPEWDVLAWTEFIHRVVALAVILLTGLLAVQGWRLRRINPWFARLPLAAVGLVLVQASLGAITVFTHLDALVVTIHLGVALTYLAIGLGLALLAVAVNSERGESRIGRGARLGAWAPAAAAGVFMVMLTGAYTAKSGASIACTEWPLCGGAWVPTGWTPVDVHLTHRWTAVVAAVLVAVVGRHARRWRADAPMLATLGSTADLLMGVQILVGAANIWLDLAPAVRIAHLAIAALIWALMVLLVLLDQQPALAAAPLPRSAPAPSRA